jgi:hypothetical protein
VERHQGTAGKDNTIALFTSTPLSYPTLNRAETPSGVREIGILPLMMAAAIVGSTPVELNEHTTAAPEWNHTHEQITEVLDRTSVEILSVLDAGDTGLRVALHLMATAVGYYLTNPSGATLVDVSENEYGLPLEVILDRIR